MAQVEKSHIISDVYHVYFKQHVDSRGAFMETYRREWFPHGKEMRQANLSDSAAGVLRGLHYHLHQADFWYVPQGHVFVALFDTRPFATSFKKIETFYLGKTSPQQPSTHAVYIPQGVAHGFYAMTACTMTYLVDNYYSADDELGILWNDPELHIQWPTQNPILSERDQNNPLFKDISRDKIMQK